MQGIDQRDRRRDFELRQHVAVREEGLQHGCRVGVRFGRIETSVGYVGASERIFPYTFLVGEMR